MCTTNAKLWRPVLCSGSIKWKEIEEKEVGVMRFIVQLGGCSHSNNINVSFRGSAKKIRSIRTLQIEAHNS